MSVRRLSEEEREVWERASRDVARLRATMAKGKPPQSEPLKDAPVAGRDHKDAVKRPPAPQRNKPASFPVGAAKSMHRNEPSVTIGARLAGLDNASWRGLLKGKRPVERRLDLHGHIAQHAFKRLHAFMLDACKDNIRCIEVVTGLGGGASGGVLRRELPFWLERPDLRRLILGVVYTHHRNKGAVRILLRAARRI